MHVIALEKEPSSLRGGQELNLLDICRGLSQRGHSISLIYVKSGNLLEQYQEFCTHILNVHSYMLKLSNINYMFSFLADIWKIPASENSVIYLNQIYDVFFSSTLALSKNIPSVCHLQLPPVDSSKSGLKYNTALKVVKQFIAVSNQTKLDWVNSGFKQGKIDVVYNGTNLEVFKPSENFSAVRKQWKISEDIRVISYVGRIVKEKGLETLIKAFALLLKSNASSRLLIAGKPVSHLSLEAGEEYKKSLEQLSTDLGIEKSVSFLGHVANITSVYQVSDVTVLPSLWSEPFGRTVIESMACGTPVVASRTGGIPEILTGEFHSGLFEPGNEQDLSDTIDQFVNWRDEKPQLGDKCREHVLSKFSLSNMIDGIEEALLSVVKR